MHKLPEYFSAARGAFLTCLLPCTACKGDSLLWRHAMYDTSGILAVTCLHCQFSNTEPSASADHSNGRANAGIPPDQGRKAAAAPLGGLRGVPGLRKVLR